MSEATNVAGALPESRRSTTIQTDTPDPTPEAPDPTGRGANMEQFAPRTQRLFATATEEARRLGHSQIKPEHLLLAMLTEPRSYAAQPLLRTLSLRAETFRRSLQEKLGGPDPETTDALTLSDGCKLVLQTALEEAKRLGQTTVKMPHLLVGLIAEGSALGTELVTGLALRGLRQQISVRDWSGEPSPGYGVVGKGSGGVASETRDNVVTLRVTDTDLRAIDALVGSGMMRTRSEAAAFLIGAGIVANQPMLAQAQHIAQQVTQLREQTRELAEAAAQAVSPSTPFESELVAPETPTAQ